MLPEKLTEPTKSNGNFQPPGDRLFFAKILYKMTKSMVPPAGNMI